MKDKRAPGRRLTARSQMEAGKDPYKGGRPVYPAAPSAYIRLGPFCQAGAREAVAGDICHIRGSGNSLSLIHI